MGKHQFMLMNRDLKEDEVSDLISDFFNQDSLNLYNYVNVDDNVILYILDTLNFIKFKWPNGEVKNELAYCGYSVIENKEVKKIKEIFKGWKVIFNEGANEIILTGLYTFTGEGGDGEYEKIKLEKRTVIKCFEDLINLCDIACKNNYSILHIGL